ncbi:MAG: efflux RND transporter periplasmic adaptor subunit [Candidatus Zixiibacteriota bacterium]|nr:MAG: efflux RND transporter periplasmic adaptor subunit [candidate division Zixibacteria bacterium]
MVVGCSRKETKAAVVRKAVVQARVVRPTHRDVVRTYTGSLAGVRQAVLRARLAEAVDSIFVAEGDTVTADQVLLVLDKYGASSRYPETLSLFRNAEKQYKKMKFLYEQGAVSETQFDAVKTDYEVKKASLDAVERLVRVQTPIAGVVTSVTVEQGEQVALGQELATVAATDSLRVTFEVNEREIPSFAVGGQVLIRSQVSDDTLSGRIVSVAKSADPVTRTFEVEALCDNTAGAFSPGQFVRIDHIEKTLTDAIIVPRQVILEREGQATAFVVVNGTAESRNVELGTDLDGSVEVVSGLHSGDTLVVVGQEYLKDSMAVDVTTLEGAAR